MEYLGILFAALISAMLINNVLLMQFLGICSFFGVSNKMSNVWGMSAAVLVVMLISSAITYPIYHFILVPLNIEHINTIAFILVIASVVQLIEMILKRYIPALYRGLGVYLPLITTNCAVLGVAISILDKNIAPDFLTAMTVTLGSALGYGLVIIAFSAIRIKLESKDVPRAFKGLPIALVVAALMSLAFMGLAGLI
ncbi:MAG: electron transport complex subunit RsxA [Acholeplasmataceae bacterium]|jgi:electron transport complex protein RnfA|nr:electron transport complex subunit RsxA [Acholeplasmataceae bacterium]